MNTNHIKSKNSVVCTIAAKLAKQGVKDPMQAAWKIYRLTLDCLHGLTNRYRYNFLLAWYCLTDICFSHGVTIEVILPQHTARLLLEHAKIL